MSHFRLEFPQPAIGAAQDLGCAALVTAVLGDGSAGNGPFHMVQEFCERAAFFQSFAQGSPFDTVDEFGDIERGCRLRGRT